jgi:hypothetical protein
MLTVFWNLVSSQWGKSILPIIKFILVTGKSMICVYGIFNKAYNDAELYLPPDALVAEMIREGFDTADNYKRMYARKKIVEGLAQQSNIKIKDMWLDILNSVFYFVKKYKVNL